MLYCIVLYDMVLLCQQTPAVQEMMRTNVDSSQTSLNTEAIDTVANNLSANSFIEISF